jgi:hypothetical protein
MTIQSPFHGWQRANQHMEERIIICALCDELSDDNQKNEVIIEQPESLSV